MIIPVLVLFAVFILIVVRRIGNLKLRIWQVMFLGAFTVLVSGQISPLGAFKAVNIDVMVFLFCMFTVGQALEDSGYLSHLSYNIFKRAKSANQLILLILIGMGVASAFLMNDTLAVIGTPVVLLLAKKHEINPKVLLLALAFGITIGSVVSPIGNPQNLLIAINGEITNPFVTFSKFLLVPTFVNILLCYFLLKLFYKNHFKNKPLSHSQEPIKNHNLAILSKISLMLVIMLVIFKILLIFIGVRFDFKLVYIAMAAVLPILLFSRERFRVVKKIDWSTLIFFIALFVLMESVWQSGFFQVIIKDLNLDITSIFVVMIISAVLSQFISNVPLVALYLPLLVHQGVPVEGLMALAAGSTIAGNLSILGAASNVIIIQNAEKKANETLTFFEFIKVGLPLTVINTLVYWVFLTIT